MTPSLLSLPWLPVPPADFRAKCAALAPEQVGLGSAIQFLAGHALDGPWAMRLGRAIRRCREAGGDLSPLSSLRLGVLGSATMDLVGDILPAAAARHGVDLDLTLGPYDQVLQQALNPQSEINQAHPDAVWLVADQLSLNLARPCAAEAAQAAVEDGIAVLRSAVEGIRKHCGAAAILTTLPHVAYPLFGSLDRRVVGSPRWLVDEANRGIVALAQETGSYLLDLAGLAERVGTDRWFDPVQWYMYKLPFAAECNDIVADSVGRLLGAIRGKSRKCLVLDLDNTLWGGVIGDDGLDGIKLGQGSGIGEAFAVASNCDPRFKIAV